MSAENQPTPPITPIPEYNEMPSGKFTIPSVAAAAGQEEGEWTYTFQNLRPGFTGYAITCGTTFLAHVTSEGQAKTLCAAHNASLREKEEAKPQLDREELGQIQAASYRGCLDRCLHCGDVNERVSHLLERLAAEEEASEPNTHVRQMALTQLQALRDYLAVVPADHAENARTNAIGELDAIISSLSSSAPKSEGGKTEILEEPGDAR